MNTTLYSDALLPFAGEKSQATPAKRGIFRSIVAAIMASNQAKAEREIRRLEAVYGRSLRELDYRPAKIGRDLPFLTSND